MKKFVFIVVLALFIGLAVNAYAVMPVPDIKNIIYQVAAGNDLSEPPTIVVPVRYPVSTPNAPKLASGEAVAWDTNSSDGTAVIKCPLTNTATFAGVLVTDVLTSDQGGAKDTVGRNWGWMCIKGKCFASMDAADYTAGDTLSKSSQFVGALQGGISRDQAYTGPTSRDVVGVLLRSTATKGSHYPVILF